MVFFNNNKKDCVIKVLGEAVIDILGTKDAIRGEN